MPIRLSSSEVMPGFCVSFLSFLAFSCSFLSCRVVGVGVGVLACQCPTLSCSSLSDS